MTGRRAEIQWLRALAAVEVMVSHSDLAVKGFSPHRIADNPIYGPGAAAGVELFFIISGYIMCMQVGRFNAVGGFIVSRILRIYPMYWLFTTVVVVVGMAIPAWRLGDFSATAEHVLRSYLILPGWGFSLLGVGWTLEYELVFYAFVAVLIALGAARNSRCIGFAFVLAGLAVIGCLAGPRTSGSALLFHIFSPYMFAFGFGWLLRAIEDALVATRVRSLAIFAGAAMLALAVGSAWSDHLVLRIAGVAVLYVVVLQMRGIFNSDTPVHRFMSWLGDASYTLYLSHWFILSASGKMLALAGAPEWLDPLARAGASAAAVAFALVAYQLMERPVDHLLRSRTLFILRPAPAPR